MKYFYERLAILCVAFSSFSYADTSETYTKTIKVETNRKGSKSWKKRETTVITDKIKDIYNEDQTNKYGSWLKEKNKATGFFRVEKDKQGRWWFIDPNGYPHINISVNSVSANKSKKSQELLFSKFGSKSNWANETVKLLKEYSFNSFGNWTDTKTMRASKSPLPYTLSINFMGGYSKKAGKSKMGSGHRDYINDLIPVFDPEFESYCKKAAGKLVPHQNDPYLIGVFSDNELPFPFETLGLSLKMPKDDHSFMAAMKWLNENKIKPKDINEEISLQFLQFVIERYFRICKEALSSKMPNHLFLGCRFHGKTLRTEPAFRGAAKYVDVLSINWYGKWTPEKEKMDQWMHWSGRPFIITEFYAKGEDSGLANTSGAGWKVKTQTDRGHFYQNFVYTLSKHPGNIGWHWFKYIDNDPTDTSTDPSNRDANKGIVDGYYKPYSKLLDSMKIINSRVYHIRSEAK